MGDSVQLEHKWEVGPLIGAGGFGRVFEATDETGRTAVIKLIPKEPGAERELLFVDLHGARNVIPIIDRGELQDSWALVMPRADRSLREHLTSEGPTLDPDEVVAIATDMAEALTDLDGRVVHRDLKPENVLLLDGHWCLADFGISRYAEASTAPDTKKFALTPAYSAPERWRSEHATGAVDVYALGIILFEMLGGAKPFLGPGLDDFREQHLHVRAPELEGVPQKLAGLVDECLYKAPETRPRPAALHERLARILSPVSPAAARLLEVNRDAVAKAAVEAATASSKRSEAERRAAIVSDATASLTRILDALKGTVVEAASLAARDPTSKAPGGSLRLNDAVIEFDNIAATKEADWGPRAPAFTVVARSSLGIRIPRDRMEYGGRSHSLWFCDAMTENDFRWFETAFMISPFIAERGIQDPFALDPGTEAAGAISPGMDRFQCAWPFTGIDRGDEQDFIDRWLGWFADAAAGRLTHPSSMPERDPNGSWRT
jgi:eukaryotic-like serine/threonine-protein kinase